MLRDYQEYVYPDDVTLQSSVRRAPGGSVSSDPGGETLPLGPGTLTNNLGIPVVVVLTQVPFGTFFGLCALIDTSLFASISIYYNESGIQNYFLVA